MTVLEIVKGIITQQIREQQLQFRGYPCTIDCSGHQAGYEYAVRWGLEPDECPYGSSNSFWEGCQSHGQDQTPDEVTEVFDPKSGFETEVDDTFGPREMHYRAHDRQGNYIDINFVPLNDNTTEIEFSRNDSYEMTGAGDATRVLATVLEAFRHYLQGHQPKILIFSAKGGSRARVYQSMINRYAGQVGYRQFDMSKLSPGKQATLAASGSDVLVLRKIAANIGKK